MNKYIKLVVVVVVLVIIDQLTKYLALDNLALGEVIQVTPFFNLTLAFNPGGAFGFLAQGGETLRMLVFIAAVVAIIIIMIAFYVHYYRKSRWPALWIIMIISGAVGNLIDRARFQNVIDFLDLHIYDYHWPTFNFADICVTLGIILLILHILFEGAFRRRQLKSNANHQR